MWSIRQWCLLLSLIVTLGVWATSMDETLLRVSVRQEPLQGGSSCVHMLSQVELVNLDVSEPIVIRSIQATPEETVFSVRDRNSFDENEVIPAQFQVLRLQSGGLTLEPNQVALVPLTFLPRYPHIRTSNQDGGRKKRKGRADSNKPRPTLQRDDSDSDHDAPVLSGSTELYDLEYLDGNTYSQETGSSAGGDPGPRSNLGQANSYNDGEYKVHATLVVETSRGTVDYPVTATSFRKNNYNVPDTILFFDETPKDCYHLHLSNPSQTHPLELREMMVSRADVVTVEHDVNYSKEFGNAHGTIRSGWNSGGPFVLSPGAQEVYVATICATPRGAEAHADVLTNGFIIDPVVGADDISLGYLQIRTDMDTLFIILERERQQLSAENSILRTDDFLSDVNKMIQEFGNSSQETQLNKGAADSTRNVTAQKLPDITELDETGEPLNLSPAEGLPPEGTVGQVAISAIPARAEFLIVTSVKSSAMLRIGLHNSYSRPIKVMVAKSMFMVSDFSRQNALKMNLGFGSQIADDNCGGVGSNCTFLGTNDQFSQMKPIPPGGTADDVIVLTCSLGSDLSSLGFGPSRRAVSFNGTVVVRASSNTSLSYDEWNEQARMNPYAESHLRLEIPYTVYVTDGKVEFVVEKASTMRNGVLLAEAPVTPELPAVSGLLFPLYKYKQNGASPATGSDGYERRVRLFSPMLLSLSRSGTGIRGSDNPRLCKRFHITSISGADINKGQPLPGTQVFDLGTITIKYVPEPTPSVRDGVSLQKCYLELSTEPVHTGVNKLPLLVYPGTLDASTSEGDAATITTNESSAQDDHRDFPSAIVTGFENLLSWFQLSFVGSALASTLKILYPGREQHLHHKCSNTENSHESYLLCRYLQDLTNSSALETSTLDPILVQHGAVGHGEVQTTSLFLTNNNPVSITVFIDVGEVEGMSISLGLDTSQAKGDGNSPLDFLPRYDGSLYEKVASGKWEGHSLGGLRQFLVSSDMSLSWFTEFAQRDAVSMSDRSVKREPLLRVAYRQSATVEFHKHRVPLCDPPEYRRSAMFLSKSEIKHEVPGPMVLSTEQGLVYPLRVDRSFSTCSTQTSVNAAAASETVQRHRQPITIPPGGVARFEVSVRGPPKESLTKDVISLVASGLVLSTNFGQVMPIMSSFEALVGQLRVTHVPAQSMIPDCAMDRRTNGGDGVEVIDVPPCLFQGHSNVSSSESDNNDDKTLIIPPQSSLTLSDDETQHFALNGESRNVSLYLNSTFSRRVRLKNVESCNPWFKVVLQSQEKAETVDEISFAPGLGVEIGTLHSSISCLPHRSQGVAPSAYKFSEALSEFPSFYLCAMNWLENRAQLHPRGCGERTAIGRNRRWEDGTDDEVLLRAKSALKNALSYLDRSYGGFKTNRSISLRQLPSLGTVAAHASNSLKSGVRTGDGFLTLEELNMFAEVTDAWKAISELELHKISSSLRATIDYTYPGGNSAKGRSRGSTQSDYDVTNSTGAGTRSLTVSMDGLALQTTLATPRLFDCTRTKQRTRRPKTSGDEVLSVLDFPPALVSNVVALTVPLRNPTAVPVRVRLASASTAFFPGDVQQEDGTESSFAAADGSSDRYLLSHDSAFIQSTYTGRRHTNAQLWWDGGGSFFLPDDNGNVIQSHHNVTITAGAGAHVSLVNPSLHSSSAFLLGCGIRCGDRESTQQDAGQGLNIGRTSEGMPIELSPIGAAAASGTTLLGRPSLNNRVNGVDILDPFLSAGGATPVSKGPPPFAVPYSSLDEIILPPYGEGELGPIFFRPPGRRSILGCDFSTEKTSQYSGNKPESCRTKYFESMVLLENSLTGLERVVLRGKGLWERVVFLDPEPEGEETDAFGDIENRHGRETLVFPGTSRHEANHPEARPVIKRVVVHNAGDVQVEFGGVYFSDATIGQSTDKVTENFVDDEYYPGLVSGVAHTPGYCRNRNFRVLGCWDDDQSDKQKGRKRNLRRGLRLLPGHNRTLYIEHRPDCTFREEYVALNLEYRRPSSLDINSVGNYSVSHSGSVRHAKANHWERSFRKRKEVIFVGFSMTKAEMAGCAPVPLYYDSTGTGSIEDPAGGTSSVPGDLILEEDVDIFSVHSRYFLFSTALASMAILGLTVVRGFSARKRSCVSFCSALQGSSFKTDPNGKTNSDVRTESMGTSSLWSAAFRCLARTDPSSPDLQTLGREQVRHVVLNRYKSMGVLTPQCMSSIGGFQRERPGSGGGSVVRKEGNIGGSEKIRTLSDSIFSDMAKNRLETLDSPFQSVLPCGLGWRAALARGIIASSSVASAENAHFPMKVKELLMKRSIPRKADERIANGSDPVVHSEQVSTEGSEYVSNLNVDSATPSSDVTASRGAFEESDKSDAHAKSGVGIKRGKHKEPKTKAVKQAREGTSSIPSKDATSGGTEKVAKEISSRKPAVSKTKKENGIVDGEKEFIAAGKSDRRNGTASTSPRPKTATVREKTKQTQQKTKRRRERHRRDESTDTHVSEESDSFNKKGSQKLSKNNDKVPKNGQDIFGSNKIRVGFGEAALQTAEVGPRSFSRESSSGSQKARPSPSTSTVSSPSPPSASPKWSPSNQEPGIRPPPGLAPPPGFNSGGSAEATPTIIQEDPDLPPIPSIERMPANESEDSLPIFPRADEPPSLRDEQSDLMQSSYSSLPGSPLFSKVKVSPPTSGKAIAPPKDGKTKSELNLPPLSPSMSLSAESLKPVGENKTVSETSATDGKPLLGLGSGFNVMDFLDQILDDADNAGGEEHVEESADCMSNSLLHSIASKPMERKSRAAAYGIAVEETTDEVEAAGESSIVHAMLSLPPEGGESIRSDDVDNIVNSIPLLTPAAVLGVSEGQSAGDDDSQQHLKRGSFHASLLDE